MTTKTKNESMNREFLDAFENDWLGWLGHPMLYDGGLCVNRSEEEHSESKQHKAKLEIRFNHSVIQ